MSTSYGMRSRFRNVKGMTLDLSAINLVFEFICLCMSLFFLRKNRDTFSKITIGYLTLVLITEISGFVWMNIHHKNNSWIYNIYSVFEAGYICCGFYHLLVKNNRNSLWIIASTYVIFIISYITETFHHGFYKYHIITTSIISVCFVLLSSVYFFRLIRNEKAFNLQYYSSFWWVAAIFVYYFGGTMYNLFVFYAIQNNQGLTILVHTMLVLNFLLYGIWSYAYICSYRHRKLLPSLS